MLFVHGWPVSGATFRTLLPHLASQLTCHVIDLPGAGSSRFSPTTTLSVQQHVVSVRRVVDLLGLQDVAVVGHDSGGLIARHAMVEDPRLRSLALIDTEQSTGLSLRFTSFLAAGKLPGISGALGHIAGHRSLRQQAFRGTFVDRSLLDGEFCEFFLAPLSVNRDRRDAAARLLRTFDTGLVHQLAALHARLQVPVGLIWGAKDPFFPLERTHDMLGTFPNASLTIIENAALFSHEEQPAAVAHNLLPLLLGKDTSPAAAT
ncbi:alpha/beta hydrolase [Dermatophilaceae bacterium Soc4.6]